MQNLHIQHFIWIKYFYNKSLCPSNRPSLVFLFLKAYIIQWTEMQSHIPCPNDLNIYHEPKFSIEQYFAPKMIWLMPICLCQELLSWSLESGERAGAVAQNWNQTKWTGAFYQQWEGAEGCLGCCAPPTFIHPPSFLFELIKTHNWNIHQ